MKKQHELLIEELCEDDEGVWLDTGDGIIKLPPELLPYLQESDILGLAYQPNPWRGTDFNKI